MFIFDENVMLKKGLTPWGFEVKRRLLERGLTQKEVVKALAEKGVEIHEHMLSDLLYGIRTTARRDQIHAVNEFLGIPEK